MEGGGKRGGHVFEYSPEEDTWSELPCCPVRWFALAGFEGRVLTVGGCDQQNARTAKLLSWSGSCLQWEELLPPMPTARDSLSAATTTTLIAAVGGRTGAVSYSDAVEVYSKAASQWFTADSLPLPRCGMSSVVIDTMLYLVGGFCKDFTRDCISVSLPLLLEKATLPPTHLMDSYYESLWKPLPLTPLRHCSAVCLNGSLAVMGGESDDGTSSPAVHLLRSRWERLAGGDLPAGRASCAAALLSPDEVIAVGGLVVPGILGVPTSDVFIGKIN